MSDKEYFEKISLGLKISVERTLKRKASLGEYVVYAHPDGTPYSIPASEALDRYMSERK